MTGFSAVLHHGDACRAEQLGTLDAGRKPDDVIALPLARRAAGIDQGGPLAGDRSTGAIGIGRVVVTVEYQNFVLAHQEYSRAVTYTHLTLPTSDQV